MRTSEQAEYIGITDVAKLIRKEIAQAFPGIKFSVRSHSYRMGCHVNVTWTDGPSRRQVERVTGRFCGKTFDGSDDSTHHHDTDWQGRRVHFAGSAPSCYRRVTGEGMWRATAHAMIVARCHISGPEGREQFGNQWVENLAVGMVYAADFREPEPLERAFRLVVMREDTASGSHE